MSSTSRLRVARVLALLAPALALLPGCADDGRDAAGGARTQALTMATPDDGHPAVVAIVNQDGAVTCSGTLIGPHTVLTAAHCLLPPFDAAKNRVFFGATLAAGGVLADITRVAAHPDFELATFRNDLGLITLRQAVATAPLALDARMLDASLVGTAFEVVGFGITAPGATDAVARRTGSAQVSALGDVEFTNTPTSAQACTFDSGGPALFLVGGQAVVTGVATHGDAACVDHTAYARVDVAMASFIAPYLASTAAGSATLGQRCYHDEQCSGGPCLVAVDEPRLSFCGKPCTGARDCAAPLECSAEFCRPETPSPGALGAACTLPGDCVSATCYIAAGASKGVCSRRCVAVGNDCPATFTCRNTANTAFFCLRPPSDDDGCTVTAGRAGGGGRGRGGALLLALLAGALLLVSARRRAASAWRRSARACGRCG